MDAVLQLNRMQAGWARALLGIRDAQQGPWSILIAECGWVRRLGTLMLERAIMLKARASLLPRQHPLNWLLRESCASSTPNWATAVAEIQSSLELPETQRGSL